MKPLAFLAGVLAMIGIMSGAYGLGYTHGQRATPVMPGLFETTGGGAVTLGCALWDVPQPDAEAYDGDSRDFLLQGDRDSLFLAAVHAGHTVLISGEQCGISLDWRRFPTEERKHDVREAN